MSKKAMKLALEVLKNTRECDAVSHAIKTLEEALAKQEHGSPEDMYIEMHKHLNCPHCGGSGHIDDVKKLQKE